ncbi:MAG: hypothetical protein ACREP1_10675, partial [Rhodanobacteraceae bacterium]
AGFTALFGAAVAGAWLAKTVFRMHDFALPWNGLIAAAVLAALIVTMLGLAGTRRVLKVSPLLILRRG